MKYILVLMLLIGTTSYAQDGFPEDALIEEYKEEKTLKVDSVMHISVVGQGVAPTFASSPAQAYALAKRAAMADAYRLIAERVKGVKVEGKDTIKNMAIKSSVINTNVTAMVRNAVIAETTYKDGMCEVEMEIELNHSDFK